MMQFGMPAFRLQKDVVDAEIEVIKELGVEIKTGVEIGKDLSLDDLRAQGYQGFYVAIGAQGGRKLGIEAEDSQGVISGIDFLRDSAMGDVDKLDGKVVVIGGGNVAVDVARSAVRYGGENVGMFCLEQKNEMPASKEEVIEAEEENITMNCGWGPKEILSENGKVTGVVFKKCVSVKDSDGRFNPKFDENDTMTVACDYVLAAIGQSIQWGNILDGAKVELNRNQTAKADSWTYQTAQPDVFVGGDVYTGPRFAIDAIAAGKEGAESLHRFVRDGHSLTLGRVKRDNFHYIDKDNINIGEYDIAKRQKPAKDKSKALTFSDERMTLTEKQVKVEAARCLGCGAVVVDQNICIGCGLCTTRCKFDAIHLIRKFNEYGPDYDHIIPAIAKYTVGKAKRAITHTSIMDK
jgi:NADPH-dependent glutamate synthase beta subunit-like oxidoreductase